MGNASKSTSGQNGWQTVGERRRMADRCLMNVTCIVQTASCDLLSYGAITIYLPVLEEHLS